MGISNTETLNERATFSRMKIYPNPSKDYANIEIKLNEEVMGAELIVYNLLGMVVTKRNVVNDEVFTISTRGYNNGIYFFVLSTEEGVIEKQKIIISK